jgi:hypothetical protein
MPSYSPDLSPIEPGWAKVKSYLRRVAARTVKALEQALGPALDSITPQDAAGFFRHCGYLYPNLPAACCNTTAGLYAACVVFVGANGRAGRVADVSVAMLTSAGRCAAAVTSG